MAAATALKRIPRASVYHTDQLPTSVTHEKSALHVPHDWRAIVREYSKTTSRGDLFDQRRRPSGPPSVQLYHHGGIGGSQDMTTDSDEATRSRGESLSVSRTPQPQSSPLSSRSRSRLFPPDALSAGEEDKSIFSDNDDLGVGSGGSNGGILASPLAASTASAGSSPDPVLAGSKKLLPGWQEYRHTINGTILYYNESEGKISKFPTGALETFVDTDPRAQRLLMEYAASKSDPGAVVADEQSRLQAVSKYDIVLDALSIIKAKAKVMLGATEAMSGKIGTAIEKLLASCSELEQLVSSEDSAESNDVDYILGRKRSDWEFNNSHMHCYRASMAPVLDSLLQVQFREWHHPRNYSTQPLPPSAERGSFEVEILLPDGCIKTKTTRRVSPDATAKRVVLDLFAIRSISRSLEGVGRPDEFCLKAVGFNDYMIESDVLYRTEHVRECLRNRKKVHLAMIKTPQRTPQDADKERKAAEYAREYRTKIDGDIVNQLVDWSDLRVPTDLMGYISPSSPGSGVLGAPSAARAPRMSQSGRVSVAMPGAPKIPTDFLNKATLRYGWHQVRQWPLHQCSMPFSIVAVGAHDCTRESLPRLEGGPNSTIGVNLFLFLGGKRILLRDGYTNFVRTSSAPVWKDRLPSPLMVDAHEVKRRSMRGRAASAGRRRSWSGCGKTLLYHEIPRGARLGVLLWERGRTKATKKGVDHAVIGWSVIQLVDELGKVVQGNMDVRLWRMEKKDKYVATAGLEELTGAASADKKDSASFERLLNMHSAWLYRESNRDNRFLGQPACTLRIRFPSFPIAIVAPVLYPYEPPSPSQVKQDVHWKNLKYQEQLIVKDVINADALENIEKHAKVVWKCRTSLAREPGMLVKVLQCADWASAADVHEAHRLLLRWAPPVKPNLALQFLDYRFVDPLVREYAINHLKRMEDAELRTYLLQLVQCVKYESYHDSPLSRFLVMRALRNPFMIGHFLFWHLQAEMSFARTFYERYQAILELYLCMAGRHTLELRKQLACVRRLEVISDLIMRLRRGEDAGVSKDCDYEYKERMTEFNDDFLKRVGSLHNPLNPRVELGTVIVDKCRYMSSKMVPLWLVFNNKDPLAAKINPPADTIYLIFKTGDDLRQDALTLQILHLMDRLWLRNGLDMRLSPYQAVATGFNRRGMPAGLIEVVLNSATTESIQMKHGGALNPMCIDNYIRQHNPDSKELAGAKDNFSRSCAGYCVATYTLGIGDRHCGNIMCKKDGHLFHIDFGHFLGNFKSKFGIKRERTAFVFTPEMAYVMSGKKKEKAHEYKAFVELAKDAFWVVRGNAVLWETLFLLMVSAGMPECLMASDIEYMRNQLLLKLTSQQAGAAFENEIKKAKGDTYRRIDNWIHNMKHA